MAKEPATIEHAPVPTSLPSGNVDHAAVFRDELATRLSGFEAGIIALTGEMEGQQDAHEKAIAELTARHGAAKSDLVKRIAVMQRGKLMASAALDAFDAEPKGGNK